MGAVSALRTTGGALSRNPIVFVGALLVALLSTASQLPQFAGPALESPAISLLASLLVPILSFFLAPFLLGGLLGMADEAVAGETSLGTFVRVGKARYVTLLLATLLYTVLSFALLIGLGIVAAIVVAVVGVSFGGGGGDPSLAVVAAIALVVLALVVVFLLFAFFLQFYTVAAVVEEAGVTECFTRSYRLVRQNLLSTLGYDLLTLLVWLLVTIPIFIVFVAAILVAGSGIPSTPTPPSPGTPPAAGFDPSLAVIVAGFVGLLVLQVLTSAITRTYGVAFYRDRRGFEEETESDEPSQRPVEY